MWPNSSLEFIPLLPSLPNAVYKFILMFPFEATDMTSSTISIESEIGNESCSSH